MHRQMRDIFILISIMLFLLGPGIGGISSVIYGQSVEDRVRSMVEERYSGESSNEAVAYGEALRWLAEHPVNVNRAPVDRLARLPGLNLSQAQNIVEWRSGELPFASIDELSRVPGIGPGSVDRLRLFATVGDKQTLSRRLRRTPRYWLEQDELTFYARLRLQPEKRAGYLRDDESGYRGDRFQYYQRLRYRSAHLDMNLTSQKDAGEPWQRSVVQDHASGYVEIREVGRLRELAIGHFEVNAGEGLLLGGGSLLGKGRNVLDAPVKNHSGGVKAFGSSRESGYFRGIGGTVLLGGSRQASLSLWGSRRRLDASVVGGDTVRYSTETGYHRTATEIGKIGRLGRRSAGGILEVQHEYGTAGIAGYMAAYDCPVQASGRGGNNPLLPGTRQGFSLHHRTVIQNWQAFGEWTVNRQGNQGWVHGIRHALSDQSALVAAYRHYSVGYSSLFGGGFGESPGDAERGGYLGIQHRISDAVSVSGYVDQYRFRTPRYGDSRPSRGYDWLLSVVLETDSGWGGYAQLKGERQREEVDGFDPRGRLVRTKQARPRHSLRLHAERQVDADVRLRFRVEAARVRPPLEKAQYGMLLYQDLRWRPLPWLQIDARFTLFDTDDYPSRVYQFENDLLYVMTNKMLHGRGRRTYLLLNLEPNPWLEMWIKYGATRYDGQVSIGSGLSRIEGNRQSKIGFQMRIRI